MNYTYILLCEDGTYYTGWTNDLEKRFEAHVNGRGAKYTKSHHPVRIAYYEVFDTSEEAMSREWHIKKLTRKEKEELMQDFELDQDHTGVREKNETEKNR